MTLLLPVSEFAILVYALFAFAIALDTAASLRNMDGTFGCCDVDVLRIVGSVNGKLVIQLISFYC